MPSQTQLPTAHRLARLVAWLCAVLAWFALSAPHVTRTQRRHQRRYGHLRIAALKRAVIDIIIIRAAQLLPERAPRVRRDFTPRGFRRRLRTPSRRAIAGVWLRRALNRRGSFAAQVAHLLDALRHYRGLGARLAWRRRGGLSRLCAIVATRPAHRPVRTLAAPAPFATDSS